MNRTIFAQLCCAIAVIGLGYLLCSKLDNAHYAIWLMIALCSAYAKGLLDCQKALKRLDNANLQLMYYGAKQEQVNAALLARLHGGKHEQS